MYGPLPSWWAAAVRASHDVVVTAELWRGRYIADAADPDYAGREVLALDVLGGSVDLDTTRAVGRTARVDLVDRTGTVTPAAATDMLTPYGNEIVLRRGITRGSETFTVPLGVFVLTDVDVSEDDGGTRIAVSASDRSVRIARNRWTAPYTIAAGVTIDEAIRALLVDRWPDVTLDLTPTGEVTPLMVLDAGGDADPWRDAQALATAAGMVLDFDPAGAARSRVPPDPTTTEPVATYAAGEEAVLLAASRRLSAEGVYNGVVAVGESSSVKVPVHGEAWDDDPASPTYRYGPFGQAPYFYASPLLLSDAQADKAAVTLLERILGQSERVSWQNIVDPALDGLDIVAVAAPGARIDAAYVLEALTYPLAPGEAMTGRARARRIA